MDERLTGCRILVVEDEYYLADDLARTLAEHGADVVGPVASAEEAERLVECAAPDCAVIDINLLGDTSCRVADCLERAGVPFLIASGYGSDMLPERFAAVPHVEKPFEPEQIATMLPKVMRGKS